MYRKITMLLSAVLPFVIIGCQHSTNEDKKSTVSSISGYKVINSFENNNDIAILQTENITYKLINKSENTGVTNGAKALKVKFLAEKNPDSSWTLAPKVAWQWDQLGDFRVAIDITNNTDVATHLFVQVADKKEQVHNRSANVPAQSNNTYYIELAGIDLEIESGIRTNPPAWESSETPFIWRWGLKNIDLSGITKIKFSVSNLLADRTLIFDNMRLLKNPARNTEYLKNLSDEFGQRVNIDTPYNIKSTKELKKISAKELTQLDNTLMTDRSKFGGWKNGPKLKATGYFRTEKVDDKWSLVDPEGYLFFSTGIANVRMANTSTITGIDFAPEKIKQRLPGDLTPEDSLGLNPVSEEALKTHFVASQLRRDMFTWLPKYDEPLAKHYGYRRIVHQGALKHGETFSFYQANLARKYGEHYIEQWKDVTVRRMMNWGFTSFGNWIDPIFYHDDRVPYFANGWIIGDFKTVSSGNDLWSALPDPFDPVFTERTISTVEAIALEVQQNPWCVGVFIDNEKSWGQSTTDQAQYGIVINTLKRGAKDSPTKAHFVKLMKASYSTINELNKAWHSNIASWGEFEAGTDLTTLSEKLSPKQRKDYSIMLKAYANEYFSIVQRELKRVLPHHLYMGARFASWGMTPEVVQAAANHVDVMSYNIYKEGIHPTYWRFLEDVDMPSVVGEFHMGAMDSGLINPGLVHAATQEDRAQQYVNYMKSVVDNPYFVGAHWFQYIDSPLTGRAYDGENYNVGFVSVTDTPYQPMVDAVKTFNKKLYTRRFTQTK
ncbi:beta-galactosidase [Thalassotalea piscium]